MTPDKFDQLHDIVRVELTKEYLCREPVSSGERLAITIRRIVENAFGILTARWRILLRRVDLLPRNAEFVVLACCTLHNFLCAAREAAYNPPGYVDHEDEHGNRVLGHWRQDAQDSALFELERTSAKNFSRGASNARSIFVEYFMREGAVPWQWAHTGVQAPRYQP
ncbi:hypothetical protein HPB48_003982 [Haemaphysalis longicornis]|uniref:DDE Tnp4 domain-containing protein n=1 Tax=Haemaphysalis longicornis TaxID=44386 RepID=A0A9J6G9I8_HAELO|nr:hypothetical protein HPB48_003982 [Haemaphysalis longicornis]